MKGSVDAGPVVYRSGLDPLCWEIDGSANGRIADYIAAGWSDQEADGRWTIGPESSLILEAPRTPQPVVLELDIRPSLPSPHVTAQLLILTVNGFKLGWCRVEAPSRVTCDIPAEIIGSSDRLAISFGHPCFARPDLIDESQESRPLAIWFWGLRLYNEDNAESVVRPDRGALRLLPATAYEPSENRPIQSETKCFEFGIGRNGLKYLRDGWHIDEAGLVWTAAKTSRLELPVPPGFGSIDLRIGLAPLTIRDLLPAQRLTAVVEGLVVGHFETRTETAFTLSIPGEIIEGLSSADMTLLIPKAMPMRCFAVDDPRYALGIVLDWIAVQPASAPMGTAAIARSDEMVPIGAIAFVSHFNDMPAEALGAEIEGKLGLSQANLMRGFESLGDNCSFGLAQRKAGAEVLGLLRFANTPLISLLRGLEDNFLAATDPTAIHLFLHPSEPREYMLQIKRYGITWHTMLHEPDADHDSVLFPQQTKLKFMRRKFEDGMRGGNKIYVLLRAQPKRVNVALPAWDAPEVAADDQDNLSLIPVWDAPLTFEVEPQPLCFAEALTVFKEINRRGPNTLLYFVRATPDRPAGTVELLAPGLMRAYITHFVILTDRTLENDKDWICAAANAWLLNRDVNIPLRQGSAS